MAAERETAERHDVEESLQDHAEIRQADSLQEPAPQDPEEIHLTTEDVAGIMDGRATMYAFLSDALLKEFTLEQINQLKGMGVPQDTAGEVHDGFASIARYLAHLSADPRTDLAVEYARVFLSAGVYDGITAEPYESVFTSDDHIMMQDARDDVVRIYRTELMDVDPQLKMPEDHLGLEFGFLGHMAAKTACALRTDDYPEALRLCDVQVDFIQDHILNWIGQLIDKVDEFAQLPFYPALMRIARGYAGQDAEMLRQISQALDADDD